MSSSRFTLWLDEEAEKVLEGIVKGEKSSFICKAIVAFHNNQLGKESELSYLKALPTIADSLVEISSNLGNVTLTAGNVGQKPRDKPGDKESGKSLDLKGFMLKNIEM